MCVCACLSNNKLEMSNVQAVHTGQLVGGGGGGVEGREAHLRGTSLKTTDSGLGRAGECYQNSEACALTFLTHCL